MEERIQNLPQARVIRLAEEVEYETGKVVRKPLTRNPCALMTLLALDAGEGLDPHAVPGDALAHVLDGEAEIAVGGTVHWVTAGHAILIPANVSHSVRALTPVKMLLTIIKEHAQTQPAAGKTV